MTTTASSDLPSIMTAQDIACYLRLSRRRVYEILDLSPDCGGIPFFRIGSSRRIAKEDFLKWLEGKKNNCSCTTKNN